MSDILKAKGNEAFKQKDYAEADRLYREAIKLDPHNSVLYSNRAMSLIKLLQWDNCIEVCETGLKHDPDQKTKTKLLWRNGIALSKLQKFSKSRESYNSALLIDSKNQSILKSIEDLNAQESQFKRSHSIEEFESEKRAKHTQSARIKIPIYEVDELPLEFRIPARDSVPKVSKDSLIHKTSHNSDNLSNSNQTKVQTTQSNENTMFKGTNFPPNPTIYELSTMIKSGNSEKLRYIFSLKPDIYSRLFSGGNIDAQFLNFVLDSIYFNLEGSKSTETFSKAIDLLATFPNVPRFGLVKFFIDKAKLERIKQELQDLGNIESILQKWS